MRTTIAAVMALMLSCGALFAGDQMGDQQQQGGATGGANTQQMDQEKTLTATVDSVNTNQKKITITGPEGNKAEFTLNDTTEITTRTGEKIKIADLQPGTMVTITYTGTRDNPTVTKVDVQRNMQQQQK